jgi:hypothetical protein
MPSVLTLKHLPPPPPHTNTTHLRAPYDYHNLPTNHYFYLGVFINVWLKSAHFCDKTKRHSLVGSRRFVATYCRCSQGHIGPHPGSLRWAHYIPSKIRELIAHLCSVASQKNDVVNHYFPTEHPQIDFHNGSHKSDLFEWNCIRLLRQPRKCGFCGIASKFCVVYTLPILFN